MFIKKIRIENFKSIYSPLEINFSDVKGFWKIQGEVGAGKTTIGEAIIFGLFGSVNGKNNGDLISWGQKHGVIEVWLDSNGKQLYVKRELNSYGQSPIYVEVDGEELIFTNKKDAQSQLESEYYDVSRISVELLCIISFNNFKSLASMNTRDTKLFLDKVLGFQILSKYIDICKELKMNDVNKINEINNHIINLESQVKKLESLSNIELIEGSAQELDKEIKGLQKSIKKVKDELAEKMKEYSQTKLTLSKEQSTLLTLGKNKAKEIKFIEQGKCPTCGATIDQSNLEEKRNERSVLLGQYQRVSDLIVENEKKESCIRNDYNVKVKELESELEDVKGMYFKILEQDKRREINYGEISNLKRLINDEGEEKKKMMKEVNDWDVMLDILSSQVRTHVLSSFIPTLNNNIYKYIVRLGLPYIVSFDENFKCNINLIGIDKEIPVSSLSTGQLKVVDMIVILGVLGSIIGSSGLNVIFLDELFSNLDYGLRSEMCKVLKETVKDDLSVFIISHMEMDDDDFDGMISLKLECKNQFEKHSRVDIKKIMRKDLSGEL